MSEKATGRWHHTMSYGRLPVQDGDRVSIYGANGREIAVADLEDARPIVKAVNALSALGDPVVVAEALPELVEAAYELTGAVGDYRYNRETYGAGDVTTNDAMDRMCGGSKRLYDLLAKLKAQP